MFLSTPKALRIPSARSVLVPRKVRRKLNMIPSAPTIASKSARRTAGTVRRVTR
jgi:hypothetical protein